MYVWVSENGLFQVWEGRKIGKDWYIVRPFDISGDKYLSRQAWIPNGPDRLIRVSERSNDEGRTWQFVSGRSTSGPARSGVRRSAAFGRSLPENPAPTRHFSAACQE